MNNAKVCHLLLGAANEVAGVQKYVASLQSKNTILIINPAPNYEKYLKSKNIPFYIYKNNKLLIKLLQENQINILHAHLGKCLQPAYQAKKAITKIRLIYTQHFIKPGYTLTKTAFIKRYYIRHLFKSFKQIIAISKAVQSAMLKRKEVPLCKIKIIHNGISLPVNTLKKSVPDKNIITICRLEKEKRADRIITLAKLMPDYQFTILGGGSLLSKLSKRSPQNCKFKGYVSNISKYLKNSSFFYFPATEEPFGLAIIEALAYGLPVIAHEGGAVTELLNTKTAKILNKKGSLNSAKIFIEELYNNKNLYQKYSKQCLVSAKKYSLENMVKNINNLYTKILKSN